MDHHTLSAPDRFACLHRADAPVLWDVRTDDDTNADPTRLPGAEPLSLAQIEAGAGGSAPCLVYCQKGGKISQLAAAMLRARGVDARSLPGGHLGWMEAGLPAMQLDPPRKWVTPVAPDTNRLATLWLLHRFVAPWAKMLPVASDQVTAAAGVWSATILPDEPAALADLVQLSHPLALKLPTNTDTGFARLLRGRLARTGAPLDALDMVDDHLAGETE